MLLSKGRMALVSGKEKRPRRLPRPFVPMKPIAVAAARTPHAGGLQPRSSSTFWLVHWGGSLRLRHLPYLLGFPMAASRRGQKAPALTATGVAPDSNRISSFQRLPGGAVFTRNTMQRMKLCSDWFYDSTSERKTQGFLQAFHRLWRLQ